MPTDEEILGEGRLTEEQDLVLYNLALRQDEYGRQATNMLLSEVEADEGYQAMLARELITLKVNKYGNGAFRGDTALRRLVLPASAGEFDPSWIAQCTALEELVLPDTMETIGRGVFASDKLRKLVVGRDARVVEPGAFQGSNLAELIVREGNPFLATDGNALYSKSS